MADLRFFVRIILVGVMVFSTGAVSGQNYPYKPIRIITPAPGSGNDLAARLIAQSLTGPLGQPVIIENRGGSVMPTETVARAMPDGYTLLFYSSAVWIVPLLEKVSWDPVRDFSPIILVDRAPNVLVVHPSVAANSVKEFIALAKGKPGELNYSTASSGGSAHLAGELFKSMAGVNMVRISYKGGAPAINALVGGEVQANFAPTVSALPHMKSGRVRALAVTSAQPSALAPGLPTIAASGLPGYEFAQMAGLLAPAKTPGAIIKRLNQEILRFLNQSDMKQKFFDTGVETVGSSPEQFAAEIKADIARMDKVIKAAGIKSD